MTKRLFTYSFILLANIMLLGHALIPHHHIGSIPNFLEWHEHHEDGCHPDEDEHHSGNQDHNDDNDLQSCMLTHLFRNQTNSHRIEVKLLDNDNQNSDINAILTGQFGVLGGVSALSGILPRHFLSSDYIDYVSHCSGLRAPPLG